MSLLTDVLGIANEVTKGLDLQGSVTYERWLGSNGMGDETWDTPVSLSAVIELKQRQVRSMDGQMTLSTATLTFVDLSALLLATPEVVVNTAVVTKAGYMNTKDRLSLPDGRTQPILNYGGFIDGGTGNVIPTEVYLG